MPANKKYLTKSFHQRFAKITAAILGGYIVTASLFLALSNLLDRPVVIVTMIFGGFIVWASIMICTFLFRNGWIAWILYLGLTGIFSVVFYLTGPAI